MVTAFSLRCAHGQTFIAERRCRGFELSCVRLSPAVVVRRNHLKRLDYRAASIKGKGRFHAALTGANREDDRLSLECLVLGREPHGDLGAKLGTLVQQLALPGVAKLRITYFGKIVDLDANAITRAIQRGYLARISGEGVNVVNAPIMLERLGLRCEIIKSTEDSDYTELVLVEAVAADGSTRSAAGTLVTKANSPRIVAVNGRDVEAVATG
eukprot:gene11860-15092_t